MRRATKMLWPALIAGLALLSLGAQMADRMVLKTKGATTGPVTLEHRAHAMDRTVPCLRCHHNMAEVGTKPCSECHTLAGEGQVRNLEKAYHDSCIPCHQAPPKGTTPPTECEGCHVAGGTGGGNGGGSGSAKGASGG